MQITEEPQVYGQHLMMLSLSNSNKKKFIKRPNLISPLISKFDGSCQKRSIRNTGGKEDGESINYKQLYNNFDTFALNSNVNGEEKEFKIQKIMDAMPSPQPEWEKPHLVDISKKDTYFGEFKRMSRLDKIRMIHAKKDNTYFD